MLECCASLVCVTVSTEKLYNVDEAMLASVEEKHRYLKDEVEKLEKESQTVSRARVYINTRSRYRAVFSD